MSGGFGMTVTVDPAACCGTGRCAANAPDVFDQDPDTGTVILLSPHPPAELHEAAATCAELCPCGAIEVVES
ncbi:ferredoxin [Streptomyces sp. NPDC058231]|uniref:ferredoxin n=1 Tax=unclassified Streptomyces TaxID=2593676 RepID=UPI0036EFCC11